MPGQDFSYSRLDHQSIPAQTEAITRWVWTLFTNSNGAVVRPRCGTGLQAPVPLSQKWRREVTGREPPPPPGQTGFQAQPAAGPGRPHFPYQFLLPTEKTGTPRPSPQCSSPNPTDPLNEALRTSLFCTQRLLESGSAWVVRRPRQGPHARRFQPKANITIELLFILLHIF